MNDDLDITFTFNPWENIYKMGVHENDELDCYGMDKEKYSNVMKIIMDARAKQEDKENQAKLSKKADTDWGLKKVDQAKKDEEITSGFIAQKIKLDAREAKLDEREMKIANQEAKLRDWSRQLRKVEDDLVKRENELKQRESMIADADLIATALDSESP